MAVSAVVEQYNAVNVQEAVAKVEIDEHILELV